ILYFLLTLLPTESLSIYFNFLTNPTIPRRRCRSPNRNLSPPPNPCRPSPFSSSISSAEVVFGFGGK
ncbi:hypothetical protein AKJ16_DCAP17189, partial [Drosera capensis]